MIDKQWLQSVKDGRRIIAELDKDIFHISDIEDREIVLARFKMVRGDFEGSIPGSDSLQLGDLLDMASLVNELLER